jgi:drug/metabolite transporter (DMT)-like permease
MAVLSGNLAYYLNNLGQRTIEVSEAAPFSYLYPIFSAILAVFLLGDRLTPTIIVGSIIIFIGVFLAEWKKRRYN